MSTPQINSELGSARYWEAGAEKRFAPSGGAGFTSLLTNATDAARAGGRSRDEQVREAVEQLVASAFILPLLNEVRDQALDSDLFHGGFAEDTFRQQLDTIMADRMVSGGNFPLVDVIHDRLMQSYRDRESFVDRPPQLDVAA